MDNSALLYTKDLTISFGGLVAVDKTGKVLLATPNKDSRAIDQGMGLALERGEELYQLTGHVPSPIFMAARLLWLKNNKSKE